MKLKVCEIPDTYVDPFLNVKRQRREVNLWILGFANYSLHRVHAKSQLRADTPSQD